MSFSSKAILGALALGFVAASFAQTTVGAAPAAPAPTVVSPSAMVQPALSDVQITTSDLNISRWKVPGATRKATQEDVNSIQRDLGGTLPGLLAQADAAPGSVPPSFAVYRNLNALYNVLLRVSQIADLAAPSDEAVAVASSLKQLEAARRALGDSILNTSQRHEAQLAALTAVVKDTKTTAPERKKETIVEDGPVRVPSRKPRYKTVHRVPTPKSDSGHSN